MNKYIADIGLMLERKQISNLEQRAVVGLLCELFTFKPENSSILWAIGKADKSIAFPWYRKTVLPTLQVLRNTYGPQMLWEALIALENFSDYSFTKSEYRNVKRYLSPVETNSIREIKIILRILERGKSK